MIIQYKVKKEAILYMLHHYNENCLNYLELDMPVDHIQILYDFDMEYVRHYEKELQTLEAITWN